MPKRKFKKYQEVKIQKDSFFKCVGVVKGFGRHYRTKENLYHVTIPDVPCAVTPDGTWLFSENQLEPV